MKIKYENTTKAIRNAGKKLILRIIAINKISNKLKVWYFKIPIQVNEWGGLFE